MARGLWEDFRSKWGCNDGAMTDARDYEARDKLCEMLNAREEMKAAGVRAIPFDRPGVHNGCMIIVLPDKPGFTNEELEEEWRNDKIEEAGLPDDLEMDVDELICEAYAAVDEE